MTSNVDLCNLALLRMGTRSQITSLTDGSTEANACALVYPLTLNSLIANPQSQAYPNYDWQWCRIVGALTTNTTVGNPRWKYEYSLPADCVTVHEAINPAIPQQAWPPQNRLFLGETPYQEGMSLNGGAVPIPVLWSDASPLSVSYASNAIAIGNWPPAFLEAFVCHLAARLAITLTGSPELAQIMAAQASQMTATAIQADVRVELQSTEYVPDWMAVRLSSPRGGDFRPVQSLDTFPSGYIAGEVAANSPVPAYLQPAETLNGVRDVGAPAVDQASGEAQYVAAWTPDSRIGVLEIGVSPVSARRPYHGTIALGAEPGEAETETNP